MSQSLVQTGAEISVSGGTSGNVTLNGVAAGNLLTASCLNDSNATATFSASDNKSNAWASAVSQGDSAVAGLAAILYAKNVAAGNTTVTITSSASISFKALIQEWSGSDTSAPLAAHDSDQVGSGTNHQASASGVNPGAACICLVCACAQNTLGTCTAGSGYTAETSSSPFDFYEYQIFSSAPTNEQGKWTSANSPPTVSVIAAFRAAVASSGPGAFIGGGVGNFILAA
jgi:hypothetical protein